MHQPHAPLQTTTRPHVPARHRALAARRALSLTLVLAASLLALGCEDASRSGNNLTCHSGSCSTGCDDVGTEMSCNVVCEAGSSCDARCNSGQQCNFECNGDAMCDFNCTSGSCRVTGGATCMCSGECPGTCAGGGMMPMGDAGPGGGSCIDACGSPSAPGYAECVAACGG